MIAPISSWAAAVSSYAPEGEGLSLFIKAIPYNFYSILTIIFVISISVMRVDFGPMKLHEINAEEKTVYRQGEKIFLTEKEYELLSLLQSRRGHTFSPVELYETIWQETYLPSSSNTVLVHIANLRKKLGEEQNIIRTVWGKGYVID